jgi:hypothetical protein
MSPNLSTNLQVEKLTASLPALQNHLQGFLAEYEDKVAQARAQLAHVEALLESLPIEVPQSKGKKNNDILKISGYSTQKKLSSKRPSLFGSDKDKIIIGEKFNEPLTEFQDYV